VDDDKDSKDDPDFSSGDESSEDEYQDPDRRAKCSIGIHSVRITTFWVNVQGKAKAEDDEASENDPDFSSGDESSEDEDQDPDRRAKRRAWRSAWRAWRGESMHPIYRTTSCIICIM